MKKDPYSSNEESEKEDRNNKEGFEDRPKRSQREIEERTPSSVSY